MVVDDQKAIIPIQLSWCVAGKVFLTDAGAGTSRGLF
jgi:hypothetical protein